MCCTLKVKCLSAAVQAVVGNMEELDEVWETLDTCYNHPEKYIGEALDPIVKFRRYKICEHAAIREFCSLLRAAIVGARRVQLLPKLINEQTLLGIKARMPPEDWMQWAKERPQWVHKNMEEAFLSFVDKKWRDSLNVAAAKPAFTEYSQDNKKTALEGMKKTAQEQPKKIPEAKVNTAVAEAMEKAPKKCKFAEVQECTGTHLPWMCKAFGYKAPEERNKIIGDNNLCVFCLLHGTEEKC